MLLYMYIAPGQGQTTPWGQMLMSTESPYHFAHLLQVLKQALHIFSCFSWSRGRQCLGVKILIPTERLYHFDHLLQVLKKSLSTLILYIPVFLNYFIHVYSPEAKADKPLGSNFDVNRKALSFWPFVASFIKNHFEVWFYSYFYCFHACI